MDEYPLLTNLKQLTSGITACIEKKAMIPSLVLIYSAIDTVGWLDSEKKFSTKNDFIRWADNYLLRAKALNCAAIDLYAARCGILHTSTPDSQLSSEKKARVIYYAWGDAKVDDLQGVVDLQNKSNQLVAVYINDLYQAWLLGLKLWGEDLDKDSKRSEWVLAKAKKFFVGLGVDTMSKVLAANANNKTDIKIKE